ncbi:acetyl-coenzyme A synthetase [Sphingomonas melonis TY]|jgi:acetyl-CoA synthetase|uniref:Acetyl-coenzyme A synthetase n=1 Tax=Sphingomonas melonis TY TaxID=621456 RepID=A0A154NAP0_9SPHN|nr:MULTISPECIES: acetate--CoA ligase [Sphingomonas]AOW23857.1 acetate--CoA ligase [Sphingomonas melonis TY]ATI54874.1 acetate--CoA ligase [Sphingomonas melonis]KZB96746.1 acetyl-coenzyme A synthetase [Sphingomonas melonis TY]MBX8843334.1 acetate--CoA ligase [Sphingomonas melonis]MBX8853222.1 acetate--CoA ligase [Sphingomonas melonis]
MRDIVPATPARSGGIGPAEYAHQCRAAIETPDAYWRDQAAQLDWMRPFDTVKDVSFAADDFRIRWFDGGQINVSANCLDRHLATRGDQVAILWEGDEPGESARITYRALHDRVCRMANVLTSLGVGRGDRVTLYLPMVPDAAAAMLACTRIGAIHSIVFGGFSSDALADRIRDCGSKLVITADEGCRGGRRIPLKANVDAALSACPSVEHVLVLRRTGGDIAMTPSRDLWLDAAIADASPDCPPVAMEAEDPLFILYTSGSTGKPKGVLHTTAGYLLWVAKTFRDVFDHRDGDVFWCTADIGWVTGHSYVVYGPLANGATTVMFDGVPNYPDHGRLWDTVDRLGVSVLYTAPTAIRALMREGDDHVTRHRRTSLRLLGSVGEPINPEAWAWYHRVVGDGRCPIVDTWWQTETGGVLICPLPHTPDPKPGAATKPLPGVQVELVDAEGGVLHGAAEGNLVLTDSWPGQMRSVWGDHDRFIQTYFTTYPGKYFTGDGCRRDADGDYWITGRVDDVINVSGHRLGTAEIESALVAHPSVAEAAVVGMPHDVKGQGIYAFVTLHADATEDEALRGTLRAWVRRQIGPVATPDAIQFAPALPKTRSGKIMRRILRKIAEGAIDTIGDTSTLADPSVVATLIRDRQA